MVCVSLFSYQGSLLFSSDSFDSLSCSKPFVKNFFICFFNFFRSSVLAFSSGNFINLSHSLPSVKNFFQSFSSFHSCDILKQTNWFISNGEGGIWTLAPRERPTPLAGAPLRPLEYFSEFIYNMKLLTGLTRDAKIIILNHMPIVNRFFKFF